MVDIRQALRIVMPNTSPFRTFQIHAADNSHILECDTITAPKAVVTPAITAITAVLLQSPDLPRCFSGTGAHKGQTFPRSIAACRRVLSVAAVGSLAKIDGVDACRILHGLVKRIILNACAANYGLFIMHTYCCGRIFRQCHDRQDANYHDQCQQTGQDPFFHRNSLLNMYFFQTFIFCIQNAEEKRVPAFSSAETCR